MTTPPISEARFVGQTLGHYRIAKMIGAGGMGEVYSAHDEHLDREVAIKVLPPGALSDESLRKRFHQEAMALSKLNHPNIATIHDFDTQKGVDFLVMEYIPGINLNEKLAQGPLSENEVVALGTQLAEGLCAAHEQGVIHRDLKPGNLRLTIDNRLKILDFGLAKLRLSPATAVTESLSQMHPLIGTLPYMAPEQLLGGAVDARTDIHAAGSVLYEMATGKRPFGEQEYLQLITTILHHSPPPPSGVNPRVSADLGKIIEKCLEKEPDKRYQSAKDLAIDLQRLQSGVLSGARPLSTVISQWSMKARLGLFVLAFFIAALLAFALDAGGFRSKLLSRAAAQPQIHSLAVLPLNNLSGDPQQDYFADGMTEALITQLSKIGALRVISRTSAMQYKGAHKTVPQIAKELNVDAIVEGSVMRSGRRVQITAQLIQASTDQHIWAESYERDLGDVLKLQSDVAQAIAQQVRAQVTAEQKARFGSARAVNPEAYQAFLTAASFDASTYQGLKKAQSYLELAIEKDPGFTDAYVSLASRYIDLGQFRWLSPRDAYPPAKQLLQKALALDEKNCNARITLSWLSWRYDWDWPTADRELSHAIELCPNDAAAYRERAYHLGWRGRAAEASAEMAKARELDPLDPWSLQAEEVMHYHLRNYKALIDVGQQHVASNPNLWTAHYFLGVGYEGSDQLREAVAEYQRAAELSQGNEDPIAGLAHAYTAAGKRGEAQKVLRKWLTEAKTSYVSPYMIATIYSGLGEKNKAFEYLEKAYQERSSDLSYFLRADLRLDSLRSDPRFENLLQRMNFPQ